MPLDPEDAAERILAALDPEQREAASAPAGPVCILAGAGTGKTRTITHRIAHSVVTGAMAPQQVLAVTFTTRAAGELRTRLRSLGLGAAASGVQARTFHSAALRQLAYFYPRVMRVEMPRLVESKIRLVGTAAGRCRVSAQGTLLRDLTGEIEWAKSTLRSPEAYPAAAAAAGRVAPLDPEVVARVYSAYDEVKREAGVLDFEDLLLLTAAIMDGEPDVAEEIRARYRHFLVDEYQDVNPLQQRLLDSWLGGRDSLCVVGDPRQTIYSFTGADPGYLTGFTRRYPDATVVRLVRDYRSTPQVVELANRVIGDSQGASLVAQRPDGPVATWLVRDDEPAEATAVVQAISALRQQGVALSEMAVLFRINAQSEAYEQALTAAGIGYVVRGGERFFDRAEVREAVMLLRGAARAEAEPAPLVTQVHDVLASRGWYPDRPPQGSGAERERWDNLAALVGLSEGFTTLVDFVADLEERAASQHAPVVDGVTLASLHAAKGLEWDAVFLVGLVDGTLPITHASTPAQVEEERRLLYVGITRARVHLGLSWALARSPGGRASRKPSRFLVGLMPSALGGPTPRKTVKAGARCRVCGAPLNSPLDRTREHCADCTDSPDGALFARLRAWRSERAKADGVPAYVVFPDATLVAIAQSRPRTVVELRALSGVGETKMSLYADDVLDLCTS